MGRPLLKYLVLALTFSAGAHAQLWSGIIQSPRATDWSTVGSSAVASSATWTQCGSTVASGSSAATINAAIAACTANHYVQLAAGSFNLTALLTFAQKSNVKLVGMGANQTFITWTSGASTGCDFNALVCMDSGDLNYILGPSNISNWTAGYSQGATSITLSALITGSTAPTVGTALVLDQLDDTIDSGAVLVCYQPTPIVCSTNGDNGGFTRTNRGQQQIVKVTAISGSGPYTVTVSPGLIMPNWNACNNGGACTPQAWWASSPIQNMGIENLSMDFSGSTSEQTPGNGDGIEIFNCAGCWVKGLRLIQPGRALVACQVCTFVTIQDSYFYSSAGHNSSSYGIEFDGASSALSQNNIFQQQTEVLAFNGPCAGCVEGYDFDIDNIFTTPTGPFSFNWRMASTLPHTVGIDHVLLEGNQGSGLQGDVIHGTHNFVTAFRNSWNGFQPNNGTTVSSNIGPMIINALNRYFNVIGNVLGTPSYNYAGNGGYATGIYSLGSSEMSTYTVPADPNVALTLMRWGNYDTVTAAVRWCGNSSDPGWSTTCGSTSEVPTTLSTYPNSVPASTTLPASFYLSAKPSWWPTAKPWPAIGPDVTGGNMGLCPSGTYSGLWATNILECGVGGSLTTYAGGLVNSIPAADCFFNTMGGALDGVVTAAWPSSGPVLSFNAATCYNNNPVSGSFLH